MIERIEFKNFKALRKASLDLKPFTLVVGPNGSGKSSIGQALNAFAGSAKYSHQRIRSLGANPMEDVEVTFRWSSKTTERTMVTSLRWLPSPGGGTVEHKDPATGVVVSGDPIHSELSEGVQTFEFKPEAIRPSRQLEPTARLTANGSNLVVVLDRLRDHDEASFERLNTDLSRWLPEFDRIQFDTPSHGHRSIRLRTKQGQHAVPASELSDGALLALAFMTLPYLPSPPRTVFIEEPERGIHPRLLGEVRDALFKLSHPVDRGVPIQVIATTHSPYFLDLFKDQLEDVVIANKRGNDATFEPLAKQPHIEEILGKAPLGEAWYTGVLGGVPVRS